MFTLNAVKYVHSTKFSLVLLYMSPLFEDFQLIFIRDIAKYVNMTKSTLFIYYHFHQKCMHLKIFNKHFKY